MKRQLISGIAICVSLSMAACASTGSDSASGERFRGNLAAMGGPGGGGTTFVDLHANRYATDEEVEALAKALVEGGPKALQKAVADTDPMGWIRIGNNTRYHLRLIRSVDTANGRVIRAITDRPIQFGEVIRTLRSRDYTFGIVELQLDANDKGSGGIIAAAEITFEDNTINIKSFGNQPFRVMNVSRAKL